MSGHTLLLAAHGSRLQSSNHEVRLLAQSLSKRVQNQYDNTTCAFLELAEPSMPEGIDNAVESGATRITILPYFLVAGRHVTQDIPEIVDQKRKQYPNVKIEVADYFGANQSVVDLLTASVSIESDVPAP